MMNEIDAVLSLRSFAGGSDQTKWKHNIKQYVTLFESELEFNLKAAECAKMTAWQWQW